jgi:iron complex outermembrane recepter protein
MTQRRILSCLASTAMALVAMTGAAAAQTGQDQGNEETLLTEIIVTAQKREQNLQEVPAAVSVLSAEALERSAGFNIEGLNNLVPSLNFRKGGTTLNSSLFLRGVGTINFSIAAEPSVATVLDGVVLARAGEAFGDLVDIERIEVLRGPQGTLFGKNASAGVVNVVSKRPSSEAGGSAEFSYFEGNEYKAKFAVDAPISDTVKTRLTAFYGQYDGNIRNLFNNEDINGYERYGVRGMLVAEPSENLTLTFIADWRKANDNCCAEVIGSAPTGANAAALTSLLSGVAFRGDETRQVRHNLVTATEETAWGLSLQADLEVADHTLTAITAYRQWDNREVREGDWLDRPAAYLGNGFAQLHDDGPQQSETFTQELRLTSPSGGAFEYIAGLYYYEATAERTFRRDVTACTASTAAPDATGIRPCLPGSSTVVSAFSEANFGSKFRNLAGFVNGTFNVTEQLRLIAGLRLTRDSLRYFHTRIPSTVGGLPGLRTDTTNFTGKTTNTNLSGKAGVQFDVTDDLMTYLTYSRGYKGPAYNVFFNMNPSQTNVIEPETANAFEGGFKSTLLDGKMIFNAAVYYAKYNDFQANNFDVLNGVVITRLTNAGQISTKGFEIDMLARPVDNLTISAGVAYTDAQIEKFRDAAGNITNARKGERLALAPAWKFSGGIDYKYEAEGLPVDFYFNTQLAYTSEQYSDIGINPLLRIDGYAQWDASLGVSNKADTVRFTVLAKNLTDQSYTTLITPGGPGGSLRYLIPREADRYFGATLRLKFGN